MKLLLTLCFGLLPVTHLLTSHAYNNVVKFCNTKNFDFFATEAVFHRNITLRNNLNCMQK